MPSVWATSAAAAADPAGAAPPAGSVAAVTAWVAADPVRARVALAAERARPAGPRVTLVELLTPIADRAAAGDG